MCKNMLKMVKKRNNPAGTSLLVLFFFSVFMLPGILFASQEPVFLLYHSTDESRTNWLRLYSAPVLSQELILDYATRREIEVRMTMVEQRERMLQSYCGADDGSREESLSEWKDQADGQFILWQKMHKKTEEREIQVLKELVNETLSESGNRLFLQYSLDDLLVKNRTVSLMDQERQRIVHRSWKEFLDLLLDLPQDQAECLKEGAIPEDHPDFPPAEELIRPYHLALYRYYSAIPPSIRGRMILALKKP